MPQQSQSLVEIEREPINQATIEEILDRVITRNVPWEEPKEEVPLNDNSEMWARRLALLIQGR
jgi:hypothetical protein